MATTNPLAPAVSGEPLRPEQLTRCALCGHGLTHTRVPLFWRLQLQRMGLDLQACQQIAGLELQLGSPALAKIFAPVEHVAHPITDAHCVLVCEHCVLENAELARIAFPE